MAETGKRYPGEPGTPTGKPKPESKPGIKTSEGWLTYLVYALAVGALLAPMFTSNMPDNYWVVQGLALLTAVANALGYTKQRSQVKIAEALGVKPETVSGGVGLLEDLLKKALAAKAEEGDKPKTD